MWFLPSTSSPETPSRFVEHYVVSDWYTAGMLAPLPVFSSFISAALSFICYYEETAPS